MARCATEEGEVIIDEELRGLIPPLTEQERLGLEENLLREGCIDPLIVWAERQVLLDGHHRQEICDRYGIDYARHEVSLAGRDEAKHWIIEHQFGRRNLTKYQRAELVLALKPLLAAQARERMLRRKPVDPAPELAQGQESGETREQLASKAGISHGTMAKAAYLDAHADAATKEKLRRGETTIDKEYRQLKKAERRRQRRARKAARPPVADCPYRVVIADVRDASCRVAAESVDWIITDPPYPKRYLEVYDHLAQLAAQALKPGGSLIAMVGQSYLPEILATLTQTLTYHWTLAYLTPGGQSAQLWTQKVNTFWKPLLWFTKGKYQGDWVGDVCRSDGNDKRFHHWGQSEGGMADIIERFTDPGDLICDPFLGAGTTGVVAVRMGRRFIGLDVDADCVTAAEDRMAGVVKEVGNEGP